MAYIDLVICKHPECDKPYLFQAPRWSDLQEADTVICETKHGFKEAYVQKVRTVEKGSEEYDFIMRAMNLSGEIKRVHSKVIHRDFKYEEDSNE